MKWIRYHSSYSTVAFLDTTLFIALRTEKTKLLKSSVFCLTEISGFILKTFKNSYIFSVIINVKNCILSDVWSNVHTSQAQNVSMLFSRMRLVWRVSDRERVRVCRFKRMCHKVARQAPVQRLANVKLPTIGGGKCEGEQLNYALHEVCFSFCETNLVACLIITLSNTIRKNIQELCVPHCPFCIEK